MSKVGFTIPQGSLTPLSVHSTDYQKDVILIQQDNDIVCIEFSSLEPLIRAMRRIEEQAQP